MGLMSFVADMTTAARATPGELGTVSLVHRPVLLHQLIESLQPKPGHIAVDGTFGAGGVTAALLERVVPGGQVVAIDRDPDAITHGERRFAAQESIVLLNGNFADIETLLASIHIAAVDIVALDLGISSQQLDDAERGFSFQHDGPLDMRMDPTSGRTAADIVNGYSVDELTWLFRNYGDERFARPIAAHVERRRRRAPIMRTQQLRRVIEETVPRRFWPKRIHPATRTFQALRIAVNEELENLERGLQASIRILRPGGRLGVISFHSLEDTLVKNTLHVAAQNCVCPPQQLHCTCAHRATLSLVNRRAIRPDAVELAANPRARSARLRVAEKLDNHA
jgi:16S rRNA (cytosine1402-N4)-methyltransferase